MAVFIYLRFWILMVVLEIIVAKERIDKCCILSHGDADCRHCRLFYPPPNLPRQLNSLDISFNPGIIIPQQYFRNRSIRTLKATGCMLSTSFTLPKNLFNLDLSRNGFSNKSITQLLHTAQSQLLTIDISHNNINADAGFPYLKPFTKLISLTVTGNQIRSLTRNHLRALRNLEKFEASGVMMKSVSEDSLKQLSNLLHFDVNRNEITKIPKLTFKDCKNLNVLILNHNRLEEFPDLTGLPGTVEMLDVSRNNITSLDRLQSSGIRTVSYLYLQGNRIKYIPKRLFRHLRVTVSLDLSQNRIMSLAGEVFRKFKTIGYILLNQNPITKISPTAFSGIRQISGGLFMFMNNMSSLPRGLFMNITVNRLLCHSSGISDVNGTFNGINMDPTLLSIYDNDINYITSYFLEGLTPKTNLYLSCKNLKALTLKELRGIELKCSPLVSYVLSHVDKQTSISLRKGGFECKQNHSNGFECKPCPIGSYNTGSNKCILCPQGSYFQDNIGQKDCKGCPIGQFVNHTGGDSALACKTCPIGCNTNDTAGTRACRCLPGFARDHRFDRCMKCDTSGIQCVHDYQELIKGYWWTFRTKKSAARYKCFTDNLLKNGLQYDKSCISFYEEKPKAYKCPIEEACLGGVTGACTQNYTGILCDACAFRYYRHLKRCVKCPTLVWAIVRILIAGLLFIGLCIFIGWADKKSSSSNERRTLADVILSSLKIILNFYQTLSVVLILLADLPWPKTLLSFSYYFRYFEMRVLSIGSLRCVFPKMELTLVYELVISLSATIGLPLIFLLVLRIWLCCIRKRHNYKHYAKRFKKSCYRYIVLFLFATYTSTSGRIFQMLPAGCITVCSDRGEKFCRQYVRADVRVRCDDPSHQIFVYLAYAALFIPFGFPIIMFVLVKIFKRKPSPDDKDNDFHYHRLESEPEEEDIDNGFIITQGPEDIQELPQVVTQSPEQDVPIEFAIRFLYENYEPTNWYWELIELTKKLLLVIALAVFGSDTRTNLGIFISLSGFYVILYAYRQPIKDKSEHFLQLTAAMVIFLNSCAGILLKVSPSATYDKYKDNRGLSIILVILNGSIIFAVIAKIAATIVKAILTYIKERKSTPKLVKEILASLLDCSKFRHVRTVS